MTILHKHGEKCQISFWNNLNVHPEIYLNDSLMRQWREIQANVIFFKALIWTLKCLLAFLTLIMIIDHHQWNYHDHVSNLWKKASAKVSAMATVFPFILLYQRKLIMKAILISQFGYCLLVWMNYSRTLNNRINSEKDNSVTINITFKPSQFKYLKFITKEHQKLLLCIEHKQLLL